MIDLDELVAIHRHDVPDKHVFAAYSAAVPVYRLRANLLVTEAVDTDPIDLFILEGINAGLRRPSQLGGFFGLDQDLVDASIGSMLHNAWISSAPGAGEIQLSIMPAGATVLETQRA